MKSVTNKFKVQEGVTIVPFDTSSPAQRYLAKLPDGKCFQISSELYQVITLLDKGYSLDEMAEKLSTLWRKELTSINILSIVENFLKPNGLVKEVSEISAISSSDMVSTKGESKKDDFDSNSLSTTPGGKDKKSPFFLKVPIFSPKILLPFAKFFRGLFSYPFVMTILMGTFVVHYFLYSNLPNSQKIDFEYLSGHNYLFTYALVIISVLFHELGHISACHRYNCSYGVVGFCLYLVFPAFYADVTDAWKLSRKKRAIIDIAGAYFQVATTIIFYLFFLLTRLRIFWLAILAVDMMLVATLNPILRFDGYWFFSDLIGVPNLRQRSMELLKQYLFPIFKPALKINKKPLLCTRRKENFFLILYSFCNLLSFFLFGWLIVRGLPHLPLKYAYLVKHTGINILKGVTTGDALLILNNLLRLFFPTLMLIGFLLIMFRSIGRFILPRAIIGFKSLLQNTHLARNKI